jgi:hypothetical protein
MKQHHHETQKKEKDMKKMIMALIVVVLFLVGLTGCCSNLQPKKVIPTPKKVIFTSELDLAIKEKITEHGFESPIVLLVGDNGKTIAMDLDGNTFKPCRAPKPEEIEVDDPKQVKGDSRQSYANEPEKEVSSELPICRGMKDITGIFPIKNITIMKVKKNPWYEIINTPDGGLAERCHPIPPHEIPHEVCP